MTALATADVERFIRDGFLHLEGAFPRAHLDIPPILRDAGEAGLWNEEVGRRFPRSVHERALAWATGNADDVYLCHPFLVHAASWPHRGKTARFIAQPPLTPVGLLNLERADSDYSPVEIAVRRGLGLR